MASTVLKDSSSATLSAGWLCVCVCMNMYVCDCVCVSVRAGGGE